MKNNVETELIEPKKEYVATKSDSVSPSTEN